MAMESESKTVKKAIAEGIILLAQGKRNLLCGEVHQAVNQFEEAAKIFSREYGDLANECADIYFLYGQALLELHRSESNVFDDAQQSEEEDEEEDEEAEDENVNKQAEDANNAESDQSEDLIDEETNDDRNDDGSTARLQTSTATNNENINKREIIQNETSDNEPKRAEDEDVSNLQLSWETLELAKLIYSRQDNPDIKLKLADTHSKLGDVGLEMEQFEEAIKDYEICLGIQKSALPEDCRRIAETLYQLGLAHVFHKKYDSSCEYLRGSIRVMELRRMRLKKVADGEIPPDVNEDTDGFYTPIEMAAKEVDELTELIKEVHARIEEVKDEEESAPDVSKMLKESLVPTQHNNVSEPSSTSTGNNESSPGTSASSSVHVITHLVRKKKAASETVEEGIKKRKLENESSNPS